MGKSPKQRIPSKSKLFILYKKVPLKVSAPGSKIAKQWNVISVIQSILKKSNDKIKSGRTFQKSVKLIKIEKQR